MTSILCRILGHCWYWWTEAIRVRESEMMPGFVYSCRRCPSMKQISQERNGP